MLASRNRVARALHSVGVADIDRSMIFLLNRLLEEPLPPLNHLDTRIVRENSFLDVLMFFGLVSLSSLSHRNVLDNLSLCFFVLMIGNTAIDLQSCVGRIALKAFAKF